MMLNVTNKMGSLVIIRVIKLSPNILALQKQGCYVSMQSICDYYNYVTNLAVQIL